MINPLGAELTHLTNQGKELIWHGDSKFWTGRAPILFPIVGALINGAMTVGGKRYEMPRHGIARRTTFECIDQSDTSVTMQLQSDETTLAVYPWRFELQAKFTLEPSGIDICYNIVNRDSKDMLCTLGSHPAFALDINSQYQLDDYRIVFNQPETFAIHALDKDGLLQTASQPLNPAVINKKDNSISLSEDIFTDDALVFRNINSSQITLQRGDKTLLSVDTGGAPHLGLWAKPGAPFVCIEPWLGTSDFTDASGAFESKPDLISLAPRQSYRHAIRINVTAD